MFYGAKNHQSYVTILMNISHVTNQTTFVCFPAQLVQSLGVVVFQALDWGLGETEEQRLSPALEGLIERMTGSESDDENNGGGGENEADDEGIDAGDDDGPPPVAKVTLEDVLSVSSFIYSLLIS